MKSLDLLEAEQWSLSSLIGYQHPFFTINSHTVINTWIMILLLLLLVIPIRWVLKKKTSVIRYVIMHVIRFFIDMVEQALGYFSFNHFCFIFSLFCFIFFCNILSLIPFLEEPTADLNTALTVGIVSFIYTQWATIAHGGLWPYIKSYFSPFFIMLPLNIISKLASIISISFRLFGNIFGGSIITNIYFGAIKFSILAELVGIISGLNIIIVLFFTLFEGFLQAFVFTMLSLTYLAMALQGEGH